MIRRLKEYVKRVGRNIVYEGIGTYMRAHPYIFQNVPPERILSSTPRLLLDESVYRNQDRCSIISFSSHGQDKIVEAIFIKLGIDKPSYLDIGCNHPMLSNNTALFYRQGGTGVAVDFSDAHREDWQLLRPRDTFVDAAISSVSGESILFHISDEKSYLNTASLHNVDNHQKKGLAFKIKKEYKTSTINEIVNKYCSGKFPDYLSIDIEGLDLSALESLIFWQGNAPIVISFEGYSEKFLQVLNEKGFTPYTCIVDTIAIRNDHFPQLAPWKVSG